ncbi:MAG: TIM barrel protein [Planctomycetota bacterium]|jgi:hydroxypyruvate isomerase
MTVSRTIKQSIALWCFETAGWSLARTIEAAKSLGCPSVELVDPSDWGLLRDAGLSCAIALNGMEGAPFVKGLNNLDFHDEVITNTSRMIDACGASDGLCTQVIAFTGYHFRDPEDPTSQVIGLDEGSDNTVKGLRALGEYAAKVGVTVSIEQLNTRDDTHPMKGHPGYQGDDIEYVADIVKRVDLPNVKLLFDLYHVQIMNGDLVRRIHEYAPLIGHVHVAGNPGRAELDLDDQEINFPACMRALAEAGYAGYVGQEWIPTTEGDEVYAALARAVEMCDV